MATRIPLNLIGIMNSEINIEINAGDALHTINFVEIGTFDYII